MNILTGDYPEKVMQLSERYGFTIIESPSESYLDYTKSGLAYVFTQGKKRKELNVNFLDSEIQQRISKKNLKSELLIKACLMLEKHSTPLTILDATAGFGIDSFLLAASGAKVTMLERSPMMAALLEDGLERVSEYAHHFSLSLYHQDATQFLITEDNKQLFDVIYLDPMHPERRSAAVNESMSVLRQHVGEDPDFIDVFNLARTRAGKRVVVKWPVKADSILPKPNFSYRARAIRYDCYIPVN